MLSDIEEKILDDLYERDYNKGYELNPKNYDIKLEELLIFLKNLKNLGYIIYDDNKSFLTEDIILSEKGIHLASRNRVLKRKKFYKNIIQYFRKV